ncbi:MAG: FAD-dependent oxidoreductase [Eubacteriales bacterium]|nr:FAD-dependent oxidoreductase [Eubacteriales bacterium]
MEQLYDVIIVGAGPAGLSAAIYMARAKYKTLILEKEKSGGQITITGEVVNYPGIPQISGAELTANMLAQAQHFGAALESGEVVEMDLSGDIKILKTAAGVTYRTLGVILATGANPRRIGFPGEAEYQGRGVAYCATCDGEFFTDMDVFVVGGGFAAVEESIFLTKYAKKVTILVRKEEFSCAKGVSDELEEYPTIEVKFNTTVKEAGGDQFLRYLEYENSRTGEVTRYETKGNETFGLFVFAGYVPATGWLKNAVELNEQGYIVTDRNQKTDIDGVYAAGDVCIKELRQVVTATSDGAIAATSLEKYVAGLHKKLNIARSEVKVTPYEKREQPAATAQSQATDGEGMITEAMKAQLAPVFARFEAPVEVIAHLNDSETAADLAGFLSEIKDLDSHISVSSVREAVDRPYLELKKSGAPAAPIRFYSVPGGHEFNSFIVALYNLAGPGQAIEEELRSKIEALGETKIQVMATLSCTMCPESVMASGRIAAINPAVRAEMFNIKDYPELKEQYAIMSVPCIVINEKKVLFGKKNVEELLQELA